MVRLSLFTVIIVVTRSLKNPIEKINGENINMLILKKTVIDKLDQKELHVNCNGTDILIRISPDIGLSTKGNFIKGKKDFLYNRTFRNSVKFSISCNGAICLNKFDWDLLESLINENINNDLYTHIEKKRLKRCIGCKSISDNLQCKVYKVKCLNVVKCDEIEKDTSLFLDDELK